MAFLKGKIFVHPQVDFSGGRSMSGCRCKDECLPYQVPGNDLCPKLIMEDFFKGAGEVIDIRFSSDAEGMFKGFGHVEFATAEEAQKALKLNGQQLLGCSMKLDMAPEKGAYTPYDRIVRCQNICRIERFFFPLGILYWVVELKHRMHLLLVMGTFWSLFQ
ncbi:hypothetical protein L1049_028605 [Liquidambar formosana]|uniref:RRM domain-containing protein n=1 Tax=Liquidambar formosana TaxID=63359 RepID=A0AAP0N9F4_LIQFO